MISKLKMAVRHNAKKNTVHLDLRPNDIVLVHLGKNKTPEKDHYKVIKVNGNEITAVNLRTGRVLRRHLSKFTRILEGYWTVHIIHILHNIVKTMKETEMIMIKHYNMCNSLTEHSLHSLLSQDNKEITQAIPICLQL